MNSGLPQKKILICGPFPEPVGGVSIHIARLVKGLLRNNYSVNLCDEAPVRKKGIFNLRSLNLFKYFQLICSSDVVHVHSAIPLFRFFHILFSRVFFKPVVLTIHSWRSGNLVTVIWRWFLLVTNTSNIFVSEKIKSDLALPGLVLPAYIPPDIESEPLLPYEVCQWLAYQKSRDRKIMVSNAYKLVIHKNKDLYGLDMCIEACHLLHKQERLDFCLLFVVANVDTGNQLLAWAKQKVVEYALEEFVLIYEGALSYIRLLGEADISIRSTNTDGDAISVRESLDLGCITFASDASSRPEAAIIFETRKVTDLVAKIVAYGNARTTVPGSSLSGKANAVNRIANLYNTLVS